ncbi:MAG: hypothetical protein R3213_09485 [Flavobacteriaceae bacterium]|nr:hypothetical protein [Flavobacteriaceae bacterium]
MRKLLLIMFLAPLMCWGQGMPNMMAIGEVTVKTGKEQAFMDGMKKYIKCYKDNGGEEMWTTWVRMNGEGTVVAWTSAMDGWAALDEPEDEAGKACTSIVYADLIPNSENMNRMFVEVMQDWSSPNPPEGEVIQVTFFDVDNEVLFRQAVGDVIKTIKEVNGEVPGYWMEVMGGAPDQPDYFVSRRMKDFTAMDKDTFDPWQIYLNKHGEQKAMALNEKFNKAVDEQWSFMYKRNAELSNDGGNTSH